MVTGSILSSATADQGDLKSATEIQNERAMEQIGLLRLTCQNHTLSTTKTSSKKQKVFVTVAQNEKGKSRCQI